MSDEELRQQFAAIRQHFDAIDRRFDTMDQRFDTMDQRFDTMDQRFDTMDQRFDEVHRHFDVTAEDWRRRDDLLAEGIVNLDSKIDRKIGEVTDEMRRGFAETHALIRFAYRYKQ